MNTTCTYDALNRLTSVLATDAEGDKLFGQEYALESDRQRDSVVEKRYDGTSAMSFSKVKIDWTYDALNRLTAETRDLDDDGQFDTGDYRDEYAYDSVGNRLGKKHGWDHGTDGGWMRLMWRN